MIRTKSIANAFRAFVTSAPSSELGTRTEVIRKFQELYPDRDPKTVQDVIVSYINSAKRGELAGCSSLSEDERGSLKRLGAGVVLPRKVSSHNQAPPQDLSAVLSRISQLESEVQTLRAKAPKADVVEIREVKHSGKTETRKVKGTLPAVFSKIVKLCSVRQNVLLVGPSGSGKTYIAEKVAEALKLRFAFVSCSAGMSEGQVAGRLLPIGVGGVFVYVPAPFVECYEKGGVFLFDEMDAADANTLTFINAAIAGMALSLPHRPENPTALRHADFVCIAAANTFGHGANRIYAARNQLDGATLDRFRAGMVNMDYDTAVEEALVDPEVLSWGRKIREKINRQGLRRIMSTRVLRDFTIQKRELGYGLVEWEESYFADWTSDDKAKV